jgi:hypothetical protein
MAVILPADIVGTVHSKQYQIANRRQWQRLLRGLPTTDDPVELNPAAVL